MAMIAGFHGKRVSLSSLRRQFPTALKGSSFFDLIRIGAALELSGRAVRVDIRDLTRLVCPGVLHWNFTHFVVLARCHAGRATILDPALGVCRMTLKECGKHFTGMALEFTPTADFRRSKSHPRTQLKELLGTFPGLRRTLCTVLVLSLLLECFLVIYPLLLQIVVDHAVPGRNTAVLYKLCVGFILLGVLNASASAMRSWTIAYIRSRLNYASAARIFRHLVRLPISFFERRHLGDILSRFTSLRKVQEGITSDLVESIVDGLVIVTTITVMICYGRLLAALALAAVSAHALLRLLTFNYLRRTTEEGLVASAGEHTHLLETLRGIQTIKIFGRESDRLSFWLSKVTERVNAEYRGAIVNGLLDSARTLLNWLGYVGVVAVGSIAIVDTRLSTGQLFAFAAYYIQFTQRTAALINQSIALRMLTLHADRVSDITNSRTEYESETARQQLSICGYIQVIRLAYGHSNDGPFLFRDLTFDVSPQESVAIVGCTGAGKSTLIKLLIGLLAPTSGRIYIDGHDVQSLDKDSYRKQIATVTEDERLFSGTIQDNITFFETSPDQDWLITCSELAAIRKDIDAMPMKYETLVGDMGSALSAGQRQRILLARAIYRRPKILFLDEATSHLDVQCERLVNRSIRELRITTIFAAHRPETIKSADKVVEIDAFRGSGPNQGHTSSMTN